MIYLNLGYKNAGLIFDNELHYSDIKIQERIDTETIKYLFEKYRVLRAKFGGRIQKNGEVNEDYLDSRTKGLVFTKTIINIYLNRNDLFNKEI